MFNIHVTKPFAPTSAFCWSELPAKSKIQYIAKQTGKAVVARAIVFKMREDTPPTVILLHGLWRTDNSMRPLAKYITEKLGWPAHSLRYHTTRSLKDLAVTTASKVKELAGDGGKVYAVTHSMGAILLRHIMELPDKGGVTWVGCCMLAPPNHGSQTARVFNKVFLTSLIYRVATGAAGASLADEISTCSQWAPPPQPCGIIAGTNSLAIANPTSWLTSLFRIHGKRASDGTVEVAETIVDDVQDFTTVKADHTLIMHYQEVKDLVIAFLREGSFGEKSQLSELQRYKEELKTLHPPDRQASLAGQTDVQ